MPDECEPGYRSSGSVCEPCVTPSVPADQTHCSTCSSTRCSACFDGWTDTASYCSVRGEDCTSVYSNPGCSVCAEADPMTCAVCRAGYTMDADRHCLADILNEKSSAFIEHCAAESRTNPAQCDTCEYGYAPSRDGKSCGPCNADETGHCADCYVDYYGKYTCNVCELAWSGTGCTVANSCREGVTSIPNCQSCDSQDVSRCASCAAGFEPSEDKLTCLSICASKGNENYIEHCVSCKTSCDWWGECSLASPVQCGECEPGYSAFSRDGSSAVACNECVDPSLGDASNQHCSSCTYSSYYSELSCDSCLPGWRDRDSFCSVSTDCLDMSGASGSLGVPNCEACGEDPGRCARCKQGFLPTTEGVACVAQCTNVSSEFYIEGCSTCHSSNPKICSRCAAGYTMNPTTSLCDPCIDYSLPLEGQNCASCTYQQDKLVCTSCRSGYYTTDLFCSDSDTCLVGPSRVIGCAACRADDEKKCDRCQSNYVLQSDGSCRGVCLEPSSQHYVAGCSACRSSDQTRCGTCATGTLVDDGRLCLADGDCFPAVEHCVRCGKKSSWESTMPCAECETGYETNSQKTCTKTACKNIDNCMDCDDTGATCTRCYSDYVLTPTGTCGSPRCYEIVDGVSVECGGVGTCVESGAGWTCTCNGPGYSAGDRCSCTVTGYAPGPGLDSPCARTESLCAYPFTHCGGVSAKCPTKDWDCGSCEEGYFDNANGCRTYWGLSCNKKAYYGLSCDECKPGYVTHPEFSTRCAPKKTCAASGLDNCAVCDDGQNCTVCVAGFSNADGGCDTPCSVVGCLICDPENPNACLECYEGRPPHCIPQNSCQDSTKSVDSVTGECVKTACLAQVPELWDNMYRDYPRVECAGHGTCQEDTGTCKCADGSNRDPDTLCAACLEGHIEIEGECRPRGSCPANCFTCDATGKCLSCIIGFADPATNCATACKEGGCAVCMDSDARICLQCRPGYEITGTSAPLGTCKPYCPDVGTPDCKRCARTATGASVCTTSGCAYEISTVSTLCAYGGECVDGDCVCEIGHTNSYCESCASGFVKHPYTLKCEPALRGCPTCDPGTTCANADGELKCLPSGCVDSVGVNTLVCSGAGSCMADGTCACDDNRRSPATKCRTCRAGYTMLTSGECRQDDCLTGSFSISYCTECSAEDPRRCVRCSAGLAPNYLGDRCIECPAGRTLTTSDEGDDYCACDGNVRPNIVNDCPVGGGTCLGTVSGCRACAEDATVCGLCHPGLVLTKAGSCEECPAGKRPAEDGVSCVCEDGYEPAGDDEDACIDPLCHKGETRIAGCFSCTAADSTKCAACSGNLKIQKDGSCGCPTGQSVNTYGECMASPCLDTVPRCTSCSRDDATRCGSCTAPFVATADGRGCVCPDKMMEVGDTCVVPLCLLGETRVTYCSSCNPQDPELCQTCALGRTPKNNACVCAADELEHPGTKACYREVCKGSTTHCLSCDPDSPERCAQCDSSSALIDGSCQACSSDKVAVDGRCVCPENTEPGSNGVCITPQCRSGSTAVSHCITCDGTAPQKCAVCTNGRKPSADGLTCDCPDDQVSSSSGTCIVPACTRGETAIPGCLVCDDIDPTKCYQCDTNMETASGGKACVCVEETELGDDGATCIVPLCKQGDTLIPSCDNCSAANPEVCTHCSGEEGFVPIDNVCRCPDGQQLDQASLCAEPKCLSIVSCANCSSVDPQRCFLCDPESHKEPAGSGTRCECVRGWEYGYQSDTCIRPLCRDPETGVKNCLFCQADNPSACAACDPEANTRLDGGACVCVDGTQADSAGACVEPRCLSIQDCVLCSAADPARCAACAHGMVTAGSTCACPAGEKLNEAGDCAIPLCESEVRYCRNCTAADPAACYACDTSKHLIVGSDGTCVCDKGMELNIDGVCADPQCLSLVPHCSNCSGSDPRVCASCAPAHMIPVDNGAACACEPRYEPGDEGDDCIYPDCKDGHIPNCVLCETSSPGTCAKCDPELNMLVTDNRCACPQGHALNSLSACAEPLCLTAVDNCLNCTADDPSLCYACMDERRRPSADARTCECVDGFEEDEDGSCQRMSCIFGSSAVPNCAYCGVGAELLSCVECVKGYTVKDGVCAKNGLSAGAIAGIVIAAVVVLAGVAVLLFFMFRRKGGKTHALESPRAAPTRNESM